MTSKIDTEDDLVFSRSQNAISKNGGRGGSRYLPYAFTEQGIYMLMTVLRGDLTIRQSKALIRTFRVMKEYIIENKGLYEQREQLRIAATAMENTRHIAKIESELTNIDKRIISIEDKAENMLMKSDISPILLDFNKITEQREYVFLDGEPMRASELYTDIYSKAKHNVYIIDNYASIKTLRHLQHVKTNIEITIFSDNTSKYLHKNDYADFKRERSDLDIEFISTEGKIHDRFIIIDYKTKTETIYHCGSSEKDAGKKLTMISKYDGGLVSDAMGEVIERLKKNRKLKLR